MDEYYTQEQYADIKANMIYEHLISDDSKDWESAQYMIASHKAEEKEVLFKANDLLEKKLPHSVIRSKSFRYNQIVKGLKTFCLDNKR